MNYAICILISCAITYLLIRRELDRLWKALKDVLDKAAEWTTEDKKRMNEIVRDINKYYSGRSEEELSELVYPKDTEI